MEHAMRKASVALGAFAVLTGSIAADTPGLSRRQGFVAASGNIGCTYTPAEQARAGRPTDQPAEISCERIGQAYVRIVMGVTGQPRVTQEQAEALNAIPHARLAAGGVWMNGPFVCESSVSGVSCARSDGQRITITQRQATVR
jgi:hypothetical protein